MLLILKTNDLMRGIEHTLRTNYRMGAFRVMTKCCVNSVYDNRIKNAQTRLDRFRLCVKQYWTLFKVNVFYSFLAIKHFSLHLMGV